MTTGLVMPIVLSLTVWAVFVLKPWRHREEPSFALMSHQWISEQRADESRHRTHSAV